MLAGMHSSTIANAPASAAARASCQQCRFVALHAVAAELVDALRPQAAVGHHGDAGRHERGDRVGLLGAPFELHRLAASFLEDAAGVFDRLVRAQVVAGERHVDDHAARAHRAADHLGVVDHLVERHRQRVVVALHDHRHAVADEHCLDAGLDRRAGRRDSRRP